MKIVYPLNEGTPVDRDIDAIRAERAMCTTEDVSRLQHYYDGLVALRLTVADDDPFDQQIQALQAKLLTRKRRDSRLYYNVWKIERAVATQRGAQYESDNLGYQLTSNWRHTIQEPPADHPILPLDLYGEYAVPEDQTAAFISFFCQRMGWQTEHFLRGWGLTRFIYYALTQDEITAGLPQRLEDALAAWKATQTEAEQRATA